jgi:hypothetical protein
MFNNSFEIEKEYNIYLSKVIIHSVKDSWVLSNLPNLYKFILDKNGVSISEKIYLLSNKDGECLSCKKKTKFLSISRGYREYCSKSCSNSDLSLIEKKLINYKKNNLNKYGVENTSELDSVKSKISLSKLNLDYNEIDIKSKKTFVDRYGVDNISKLDIIKDRKIKTTLKNYGVQNPFQSEKIKDKIKNSNLIKYGVNHPMKSDEIINKYKETSLYKWGVDNYTKTDEYKKIMFDKYHNCDIKTNLNSDINYIKYIGFGKYEMNCDCDKEHSYITNSHLYHARRGINNKQCTVCYQVEDTQSFKETEVFEFISSIYNGEIIRSYRDGLEIDIYLPNLNIGFEFNGLYWHSELFKQKNYHLDKLDHFRKRGIRIINIWEDDWSFKCDVIKSQIRNWIGISDNKIFARKCKIEEIKDVKLIKSFLNDSHIQGYVSSSLKIGLFYEETLVSLMTFDHFEGRKKMQDNEWNLSRFCNKLNVNVIGGASKLLNYFIKLKKPKRIISFADKSWSNGSLYFKLGFELSSTSYPNYSYFIDKRRVNKQRYKKSNLVKIGYDKSLSESKIMEDEFGSYKIFDCGQLKFEKKI